MTTGAAAAFLSFGGVGYAVDAVNTAVGGGSGGQTASDDQYGGQCVEYVNPHGQTIPPAGLTPPGTNPKGGENPDGFYQIGDPSNPTEVFVIDLGSGTEVRPVPGAGRPSSTRRLRARRRASRRSAARTARPAPSLVHITGTGDFKIVQGDSDARPASYLHLRSDPSAASPARVGRAVLRAALPLWDATDAPWARTLGTRPRVEPRRRQQGEPQIGLSDETRWASDGRASVDARVAEAYASVHGDVVRYLGAVVGRGVAEDVASQVWVEVVAGAGSFRGDADAFRRWVLTTARRRALDHRRRWWQRSVVLRPPGAFELDRPVVDPELGDDVAAAVARIKRLPAPQAEVILLRVLGGLQRRGGRRAHGPLARVGPRDPAPRAAPARPRPGQRGRSGRRGVTPMGLRAFFLSMRAVRLDDETADRMLAGGVDPADAPPGYAAVAALLQTARSAAGVPVPAATPSHPPVDLGLADTASGAQAVRRPPSGRRRIPVLAAVAFCAMTGGAYAAGVTGAGSSTVSAVLDRIGVGSLVGSPSGTRTAATSEAALKGEAPAQTTTGAAADAPVGAVHRASHDDAGRGHRREGQRQGAWRRDLDSGPHDGRQGRRQGRRDLDGRERRQEPRGRARQRARREPSQPPRSSIPSGTQPSVAPGSPVRRQRRRRTRTSPAADAQPACGAFENWAPRLGGAGERLQELALGVRPVRLEERRGGRHRDDDVVVAVESFSQSAIT